MTALREPRFPEPEVPAGATALAARLRALVAADPDRPLVTEDTADGPGVVRTRAEFDARTNRLARAFAD
ncbi:hypothetical protein GTW08_25745, partial [Pseudonocardia sp. SID8383]|nr:hypothetical protein [Pseudonocardia sp. SID8383]